MMGGKYAPVLANNGLVTVGNQQSAIQRLTQERYQFYDTPDTYEARIRPLLLGVVDNDAQVLGFLKSHLTHGQNLSGRIPEKLSQIPNQIQALPSINPLSYSLPLVAP
ncbi:1672_t:CDS:2, partial [Cetraspora pellucida]